MKNKPTIVFWDLETCPDPVEIFKRVPDIGSWPGRTFKTELHRILSFGYRIEGASKARIINAWDFDDWRNKDGSINDYGLVVAAAKILRSADMIVTHNGKQFDWKAMQTRLIAHGEAPLPPIKHFDTKTVAKSKLSLYSNSLSEVAKFLECADKMTFSNKWGLWVRIAYNQQTKKDLKLMSDYCKQDVDTLREVYHKLKPLAPTQVVNHSFFSEENIVCSSCGGTHLISHGFITRKKGKVQRLLCKDCGTSMTITNNRDTAGANG